MRTPAKSFLVPEIYSGDSHAFFRLQIIKVITPDKRTWNTMTHDIHQEQTILQTFADKRTQSRRLARCSRKEYKQAIVQILSHLSKDRIHVTLYIFTSPELITFGPRFCFLMHYPEMAGIAGTINHASLRQNDIG